ncbi:MAG: HAMP domain-containing histidine kinase [Oscillospiraceae bacterium]|jgi:signal transduction histidine kinase|nr:HAMP domain-containing histidine kinase [Oscillospiraceae bacterium]
MIRNLQLKFIGITMAVLMLVFTVVFITLNLFMRANSTGQTDRLLEFVAARDGVDFMRNGGYKGLHSLPPPESMDPRMMRAARFFYVKVDHNGAVLDSQYDMIYDLERDDAVSYAAVVLEKNQIKGVVDSFQYLIAEKDYGKIVVFAERSIETQLLSQLIYVSLVVAGLSGVVLLVFAVLLSRWAVRPVKTAFDKQRRFVSDASHELKTPLTIIAANADVLENEIGDNIRVKHVREQAGRMNRLIHDLLALAKTDEKAQTVMAAFDLSQVALSTVLEFESVLYEAGKKLDYAIEEGISYTGDEAGIRQVMTILIDNAAKHSEPAGNVKVTLKKEGNKAVFSVYNTGIGVETSERERIFERFYRSDVSRSRETGGYGLGLAIAKSVVDAHRGKIQVTGKTGVWVQFTVTL